MATEIGLNQISIDDKYSQLSYAFIEGYNKCKLGNKLIDNDTQIIVYYA